MEKWIQKLIDEGYTYAFRLKNDEKEVYATKGRMRKNDFSDNTLFDVFKLNSRESFDYPFGEIVKLREIEKSLF